MLSVDWQHDKQLYLEFLDYYYIFKNGFASVCFYIKKKSNCCVFNHYSSQQNKFYLFSFVWFNENTTAFSLYLVASCFLN